MEAAHGLQKDWKESDEVIRSRSGMGRLEPVVLGIAAAGILLVSLRQSLEWRALRAENAQLRREIGMRMAELESLRPKKAEPFNGACGDSQANRQRREHLELLRLRGEVGLLRRALAEEAADRGADARAKTITLAVEPGSGGSGPRVQVSYDPAVWKPWEPEVPSESVGPANQGIWDLKIEDFVQVQIRAVNETNTQADFRQDLLLSQKVRNDPAELVREGRQPFGGSEWMVLEFYNPNTRPPRTEITYFLAAPGGSVTMSVVGTAEVFANYRGTVERFLAGVQVVR